MNKHVKLVLKWLSDPSTVTLEELDANRKAAMVKYRKSGTPADRECAYATFRAAYIQFGWEEQT